MRYLIAIMLFALPLYLVASTGSYHDARRQAAHCQQMVAQGAWPKGVCDEL